MCSFRERLLKTCEAACSAFSVSQEKMKGHFDKAVQRSFAIGDQVLCLLPIPGSALQAKFCGPYRIEEKLSETYYVVGTPDHRRNHINMLKPYFARSATASVPSAVVSTVTQVAPSDYSPESDGLHLSRAVSSHV